MALMIDDRGSDSIDGGGGYTYFNPATGHEFSGEIVAIGKDVDRRLKVGQRVDVQGVTIGKAMMNLQASIEMLKRKFDAVLSPDAGTQQ